MSENCACVDEKAELRAEIDCLRKRLYEADDVLTKRNKEFEMKCKENDELHGKIKFLEGQIEAYQYCMNCRR